MNNFCRGIFSIFLILLDGWKRKICCIWYHKILEVIVIYIYIEIAVITEHEQFLSWDIFDLF